LQRTLVLLVAFLLPLNATWRRFAVATCYEICFFLTLFSFSFQWRGRHDITNIVLAGCISGALLGVRGQCVSLFEIFLLLIALAPCFFDLIAGPQAMVLGCGSFAAFSYAMEKFMHKLF
jgi:hypothetical protein